MKGRTPTFCTLALLVLGVIPGASCVFDPSGVAGPGDAQLPPDSTPLDASPLDAGAADAEPVDAGSPCQGLDPPWWDDAWHRRRPIDLGTVPEDYTVTLEVTGSSQTDIEDHARPDLEDVRVLRYDGAWLDLDRTVRSEPTYLRLRFRVREDQTGLSGQPRYFLYYDHPNATTAPADLREVYLFFDDFERADLGLGTVYQQWDQNQLLPGSWTIENGALIQDGTGSLTALVIPALAGRLSEGFLISYRWLGSLIFPDSGPVFHWDATTANGSYLERQYFDAVLFSEPSHAEQGRQAMSYVADDNWHRHTLTYHGDTLTFDEDGDGPQFTLAHTPTGTETVGIATFCTRTAPFRFDNLTIQLYQDPQPTPTLGNEQFCAQL